MGNLIMPKNNAEDSVLEKVLKIYYDANGWLSNEDLITRLSTALVASGKEDSVKEPQSYTKKTQVLSYFGFIEWESEKSTSRRRLTESGRSFYENINNQDTKENLLMEALEKTTFGRNNFGCTSDSDYEAPCIFIRSSLLLGGISNSEFAYILWELDNNKRDFAEVLTDVLYFNKFKLDIKNKIVDDAKKYEDPKPITALKVWKFLEVNGNKTIVSPNILQKFGKRLFDLPIKNTQARQFIPEPEHSTHPINFISSKYFDYAKILRTKPFLLLAGISGTGKSRLVKELAYMTCPQNDELRKNPAEPGNYCLIEVKPNWHDSAELLGYYSNLSGRYELTKFIRFAYKAIKHPDTPFFVCLDEMNLAPVEQYFAEYLSVLETRKLEGDKIISSALLSRDAFANCRIEKTSQALPTNMPTYEPLQESTNQSNAKLYSDDDEKIIQYLKDNGLTLPENLFVIGTVNMDDTTHQFSRKVIDRAFTIEMNGGNLSEMFDNKNTLDYRDDVVPLDAFKPKYVTANEALDEQSDEIQTTIKEKIPELLESINNILKETPFCVSYRVQNELILYLCNILDDSDKIDEKISEAFLTILLTKILPRIQGDDKLLKTKSESGNDSNVLTDLQEFVKKKFTVVDGDNSELFNSVINKLEKMNSRLENSYFANFFG